MRDAAGGAVLLLVMGAAVLAFAHVYAALVARSTVYAITERRLVLRIGVAIPAVLNIPFDRVESVDLRAARDGTGDVTVTLTGNARVAYLLLWPHARPWRYAQPQPALRGRARRGRRRVRRSPRRCARAWRPRTHPRPHPRPPHAGCPGGRMTSRIGTRPSRTASRSRSRRPRRRVVAASTPPRVA
jgi:hypothetical protein